MVSEVGYELQKIQFRLRSTRLIQEITYAAASSTSDNLCHSHLWPIWSTLTRFFQFFCILSRGTHMSLVPLVPLIDFPYQYPLPILFSLSLALITSKKISFQPSLNSRQSQESAISAVIPTKSSLKRLRRGGAMQCSHTSIKF